MKIDTSTILRALDGSALPFKATNGDARDMTLKDALIEACMGILKGDDSQTGAQKLELFNLAQTIFKSHPQPDLTAEDISVLKDRVGKAYPALIVGRVYEALGA